MKVLRIGSCLLLLLTQTIFMGCSQEKKEKEEVASHDKTQHRCMTHPLTIKNCKIEDSSSEVEVVEVCDNDSVVWTADDDNYQITFVGSVVPIKPGPAPFVISATTSVSQQIHGLNDCSDAGCYYKYNLARVKDGVPDKNKKPCRDPGIRIIP